MTVTTLAMTDYSQYLRGSSNCDCDNCDCDCDNCDCDNCDCDCLLIDLMTGKTIRDNNCDCDNFACDCYLIFISHKAYDIMVS